MLTIRPTLDICGVGHPWAPAQCHWVEGWGRSQGFHPRSPTGFWISFLCPRFQVGLDVILRPGPFIDAERDFGGLPYWLLKWAGFFLGSKIHSGRGKESWEPVTQSSWLEWGPGTSNCSQGEPISLLTNILYWYLPDFRVCSSTKAALS